MKLCKDCAHCQRDTKWFWMLLFPWMWPFVFWMVKNSWEFAKCGLYIRPSEGPNLVDGSAPKPATMGYCSGFRADYPILKFCGQDARFFMPKP
jgi:hypothetical protein